MFLDFARMIAKTLGDPRTFVISIVLVMGWALSGPMFNFNDTWQLFINTGTTIITFLIVIILQHSSNYDSEQLDDKLNQIIALLHVKNLSKAEKAILAEYHEELIEDAIEQAKYENEEDDLEEMGTNN